MPFVTVNVSGELTAEQEVALKARFGKAITNVPGKSEEYLLLNFRDHSRLWLAGSNDEPLAFVEVAIFGNESHRGYEWFTEDVTNALFDILGISPDRVYLNFTDIPGWSVNGLYLDRRRFG